MSLFNNTILDNRIIESQKKFFSIFNKHFTFNMSLILAISAGTTTAFIGSECYGHISVDSPLAALVMSFILFSSILVLLFIKLPMIRLLKFATVVLSSNLLAYETFALYTLEVMQYEDACKPYLYTDDPVGYVWIVAPMLAIIAWCFAGNNDQKLNAYLKTDVEPKQSSSKKSPFSLIPKLKRSK